jgi:hypothetical protein
MLSHRLAGGARKRQRRLRGLLPGYDLEQAHRRRRVEEVHSDDPLGPLGRARDRGHEQRGRVGREHALFGDDLRRQPSEQRALKLEALRRGFDHQLARGQVLERRRGREAL